MRLVRSLVLAAVLIVPVAAWADDGDQVPLTAPIVEHFIAAHAELTALANELAKKYGDRSDTEGDDPVASLPAYQDIADAKTRTAAILAKNSFKSLDEVQIVTNSVMLAYQADMPATNDAGSPGPLDKSPADLDAEKARAKADIDADATLTPDRKKEALQQLDEQYASLQALMPLPGNAEAVKPYLDKLKSLADAN
jgi:hypothetical protein